MEYEKPNQKREAPLTALEALTLNKVIFDEPTQDAVAWYREQASTMWGEGDSQDKPWNDKANTKITEALKNIDVVLEADQVTDFVAGYPASH